MADYMQQAKDMLHGVQRGMTSDLLGTPVDLLNLALRALDSTKILPQRFSTEEPVLGSNWWHRRLQNADLAAPARDTPTENMGRVLGAFAVNPTTVGKTGALLEDFAKNRAEYYSSLAPFVSRAVKDPGGVWHPDALQRLSIPLETRLNAGRIPDIQTENSALYRAWSDRAVRNYLNKYAGTTRDPLKDIEIPVPFAGGTKRWEDVTDSMIGRVVAGEYPAHKAISGARPEEPIWNIWQGSGMNPPNSSRLPETIIKDYLSHVGDYLRQNVPPAKLQQYDLTRAVRETAANDARVAKDMERALQDSNAHLSSYKDYPDGFRWVELKLPEKLTPEQAKGVRPESFETWLARMDHNGRLQRDHTRADQRELWEDSVRSGYDIHYEALDAQGKPIENSYTREPAVGRTPEKAWLAGQLAREGNRMGHCVGGYCEGVAAGESRIYSLRDAKGESHVTVEVEPGREAPKGWEADGNPMQGFSGADSILQIKGKQNRAPNSEYLPYVQDFVRSGKWGDVQDLRNTGLWPMRTRDGSFFPPELENSALQIRVLDHLLKNNKAGYFTTQELLDMAKELP